MIEQVPIVYSEVTRGVLSNPTYFASSVISVYEENQNTLFEELLKDSQEIKEKRIKELEQENKRLRQALEKIAELGVHGGCWCNSLRHIAREALGDCK
jgi:cell shape-determining protein MreC